jgi:hypothetical protein
MTQAANLAAEGSNVNSSGVLGIAGGGTNSTATPTNGGVVYGNGSAYSITSAGTSGYFLQSIGAGAPTWGSIVSGQYQYSMATRTTAYNSNGTPMVFVSTGSFNWTAPTGVTRVRVICIAGGGGAHNNSGNWGGAGGQAQGVYTVSPGTVYAVTVGAGGSGTSTGTGGTGGTSSFSTLISASGGTGANGSSAGTNGSGTNGNINNTSDNGTGYYVTQQPFGSSIGAMFGGFMSAYSGTQSPTVWTPSSQYAPGTMGGGAGAGGVSGIVLVEYVG